MTTDRERVEVVLKRLRDSSPLNTSVSDEDCADIIETLMRENEALREDRDCWKDASGLFESKYVEQQRENEALRRRIADLEPELCSVQFRAERNHLSFIAECKRREKAERENEALRKNLEALRFALAFTPKPTDYGTA